MIGKVINNFLTCKILIQWKNFVNYELFFNEASHKEKSTVLCEKKYFCPQNEINAI
jgi:hypothetical protein